MITKIVSGGQTGADQAALDVAIELGIPHGGWIPKGRKTEAGPLPAKYKLKEMPTTEYPKRTEQNVIDSDGTLIISHGELTEGSDYTRQMAEKHGKPWLYIDADKFSVEAAVEVTRAWVNGNSVRILNVAGPRASKDPEIQSKTKEILKTFLSTYNEGT
jgi:predicted Rossmann-fold nucleotide-binding protein